MIGADHRMSGLDRLDHPMGVRDVRALAALLAVSGVLHFVVPSRYEAIVPRRLPARRALVYASGVVELGCAAGLALPSTRRVAGLVSAGLLVAVFPANVQMTVDVFRRRSRWARAAALARLPMQLPLVRTAYRAWRV
jgi:uncharacterized membrane protein